MSQDEFLNYLILKGQAWVKKQRDLHRLSSTPLEPDVASVMEPFFGSDVVSSVRLRTVPEIPNPDSYDELKAAKQPIPLDFRDMTGIAYSDTVLFSDKILAGLRPSLGLVFHELVHVVQYRLLGVDEFISQYIRGWAENGMVYRAIPLEVQAYDLQERFERKPSSTFSVEREIARPRQSKSV